MANDQDAARMEAIAALETNVLENISNLADIGQQMKDALEQRGFSSMVAEPAAIQYMYTAGAQFVALRNSVA